jgi:hypothetical protein
MKTKFRILELLLLFALILSSCNSGGNKTTSASVEKKTIEDIILVPTDYVKNYTIEEEEDLSYDGIIRNQLRITIPAKLERADIENVIKQATIDCFKKNKSNGISILIYEKGDNVKSAYTVAMGEFAPLGDWDLVLKGVSLPSYKLKIEFNDGYFKPKAVLFSKGTLIKSNKETEWSTKERKFVKATKVPLSKSVSAWTDEYIIISVPNNTKAKIVDIHRQNYPNGEESIR